MAGLDPAIQVRHSLDKPSAFNKAQFLDGRVKPGHDEAAALILAPIATALDQRRGLSCGRTKTCPI